MAATNELNSQDMGKIPQLIFSNCEECRSHKGSSFCNLPKPALKELDRIKHVRAVAQGDRLFNEGRPVEELMIVCEGGALLTFASNGRTLAIGVSEPNEVLGLSSVISGRPHEGSAEAIENTRVAVINRSDFLNFLERFPAAALNASAELSRKVNRAYDKIRLIGAGFSVRQRLAAWLLRLQNNSRNRNDLVRVTLTHERIAQLLGVSRESVTRALSGLRKQGIIDVHGIQLRVCDRKGLESIVFPPNQPFTAHRQL